MTPLMLFEDVPLLSTSRIGSFREETAIGHHYGDLSNSRVRGIKMEEQLYLISAHPWQVITRCWVNGKRVDGFEALVRTDVDGETRQYIALTAPPAEDEATVEVSGKGKVSTRSGKLLENPDEVIEDIAAISGRSLNFPFFREACYKRGLRVAGAVDAWASLRSYINEIVISVGARWLGDNIVFYPYEGGYAKEIQPLEEMQEEITLGDVAGALAVYYAWNSSAGQNSGYIELTARGCEYENRGIYYAKWLRLAKDAEELGRRLLSMRAGQYVRVSGTAGERVRAGDVVQIEGKPYSGPMLVLEARPDEVQTEISGEIVLSTYDNIYVSQIAQEKMENRNERVEVLLDPVRGTAEITVFDSGNRPMVGILITIDGIYTQKSDKLGYALFTLGAGAHTLTLAGEGIDSNEPYPLYVP